MIITDIVTYSIILVLVDAVFLNVISNEYGKMIQKIQGSKMEVNMGAALVVYIALVGIWYVFIHPEIKKKGLKEALCKAFILGLFTYAIYDFTNMAILKDYRFDLAVIDSVWGGLLFSMSTYIFAFLRN